ncbi:hypothetical protein B9Z55_028072 [Caenorhabditis nigoni]|uniref:Ubiquitin-like domain-containing protein n=1 Tax=Caenorhabditis nigoni TaxID=1611254 RepID=A0A2G5SDI9_9PELO|nr:hypothetical protein B9Z55_028072 [Caenorhabditis nigoni]
MFELWIRSIKSDMFTIQLESDEVKVSEVRRLVNEHLKLVDGDFYMTCQCRSLSDDEKTLAEYNIKNYARVDVMFRMRGGPGYNCPGCEKSRRIVAVHIQDSTGSRHEFQLENNDVTISCLREYIDSFLNSRHFRYRLVGNFGIMQNDRSLASYGIQNRAYIYINSATPESAYETMFVSPEPNPDTPTDQAIEGARRVIRRAYAEECQERSREREENERRLERIHRRENRRREREENQRRMEEYVEEMPDELIPPPKRSKDEDHEESQQRMEDYSEDEMPDELIPPPAKKSK